MINVIKIYEAGSLFTDKEIRERLRQESLLKETIPNCKVYNPISNE